MIETYRGVVYPYQLDHMGHMNVQWYTEKFDEANWHLFSRAGLSAAYFREHNKGMAAVQQTTKYHAEALAGDLLQCRSGVMDIHEKTLFILHEMYNTETQKLIATTELICAHLDRETRHACPFPLAVRDAAKLLLIKPD
ncbi:acyl-CoA thioesterase [Pseudovibrio ascidiaceicola]|uniref:acyl-CoA thioesterase n=1 Tax=Pseudovibrio ascidiaceicola TaxID=285279 RepID=UPI003D364782